MKVSAASKNTLQLACRIGDQRRLSLLAKASPEGRLLTRQCLGLLMGLFMGLLASLLTVTVMAQVPTPADDSETMTREQILALFEKEAQIAYRIARESCAPLTDEAQKRCLAKARLQYDADRRYARKRADLGY